MFYSNEKTHIRNVRSTRARKANRRMGEGGFQIMILFQFSPPILCACVLFGIELEKKSIRDNRSDIANGYLLFTCESVPAHTSPISWFDMIKILFRSIYSWYEYILIVFMCLRQCTTYMLFLRVFIQMNVRTCKRRKKKRRKVNYGTTIRSVAGGVHVIILLVQKLREQQWQWQHSSTRPEQCIGKRQHRSHRNFVHPSTFANKYTYVQMESNIYSGILTLKFG